MEVAPSGGKQGDQTDPGMGEISPVTPDDMPPGDRSREYLLEWIENVAEVDPNPGVPPTYIVRHNGTIFFFFFTFSLILGHN